MAPATTTAPGGSGPEAIRIAYDRVRERMAAACARVGRDLATVELVAVSKTVTAERLQLAVDAGIRTFGENRVQEAATKVPSLPETLWHLVGPLQANKVRKAVELFDTIQTVDSIELGERLGRIAAEVRPGRPMPVLVQVDVDDDPGKAGVAPEAVGELLERLADIPELAIDGLMTIGRLVASAEAARPTFVALRSLSERLQVRHPVLGPGLSMGMTDDFEVAIEEGATIVRVGRAIFGARPAHPG